MRNNVYRKIVVSPRGIKRYYNNHIDEFSSKGGMSFRHILIKFSGYDTKEEAKLATENLLNKLKEGADFNSIAKEHSRAHTLTEGVYGKLMR